MWNIPSAVVFELSVFITQGYWLPRRLLMPNDTTVRYEVTIEY